MTAKVGSQSIQGVSEGRMGMGAGGLYGVGGHEGLVVGGTGVEVGS